MASPPPFDICDDLDDDIDEPATAHRHHPAAAPTPNGLNDRLLRLARSRQDPNPNPNPIQPPEAAAEEATKVKRLAGRRRLCKLAATQQVEEQEEWADHEDGESIRDIMDDLTTRLDALSVHKPNPTASPRERQLAPLPCHITEDPDDNQSADDGDAHDGATSPVQISTSDDEATATTRPRAEVKPQTTPVTSAFTDHAFGEVRGKGKDKGTTDVGRTNRMSKASSFVDCDSDYDDDFNEEEGTATACAAKHVRRKQPFTMRPPKASAFRNNEDSDDGLGQEKENRGAVENDAEDVGWEKTEDFKMEPTGTAATSKPYKLPGRIFKMLYPHQREGLRWLWVLHCRGTGGILGDDMGLGKTMQEGGVLLTTYDIVRNNYKLIRGNSYNIDDEDEEGTLWNYVILDEGHLIKNNKTQRAQSLFEIPCVHRIVISGTPIQNNLKEMWALFNFSCPDVLGDKQQFKTRYEMAILRGNDKNATAREKHVGSNVAKELRERIKPYFLRRMKSEVFLDSGASEEKTLSKKNELIVWLKLTACQRKLYEAFLKSELVHLALQPKGSPLAAITILKKICDHPLLLTKKAAEGVLEGMDEMLNDHDIGMVEKMAMNLADMAHDDDALQVSQDVSCKLSFIMSLLRNLVEEGHHVLIFSQTRKMLNLIQEAILLEGYKFLRIDGMTKVSERERIVKDFQEGPGAPIFLLTTQVGGLGLTLTKAARVIVVDPAWNPSTDNQSVDRAYRIGQTKDVIVYRLMTSATIEEKIYKLQ
ncbi:Protein CHROMATIN REMODELING 24, partial [Dichanthelium oligosanthes]